MLRTILNSTMIGLLLLGMASTVRAFQANDLREKAQAMQKEADALAEGGRADAAERLTREATELIEEAERQEVRAREKAPRPEIEREIGHLKRRLQDLMANERQLKVKDAPEQERAEVRERIAGTKRELVALRERSGGEKPRPEFEAQARKIDQVARRIHHIRVAAENLKAAEAHDLAMQLMEKAEVMEREVREAKERLAGEMERDPRDAEIRELRQQNERLQAEIRELQHNLERR